MNTNKLQSLAENHSFPPREGTSCNHCWAPGDAVQVVVDTPFGPVQGPFTYKRRCILCGKETG